MSQGYIRVWQLDDIDFIKQHLVIIGDLTADCANCKHIGIDYQSQKTCPNCKTEFKYAASRSSSAAFDHGALAHKIKKNRPDLILIDFSDFKRAAEKTKAREFFK